ncbi:hypothetical protein B932_0695 [Gluconobacter oxydans H24]|nr:hypothetical protein B932_0695 [Gluconobacter oxydans H24]
MSEENTGLIGSIWRSESKSTLCKGSPFMDNLVNHNAALSSIS